MKNSPSVEGRRGRPHPGSRCGQADDHGTIAAIVGSAVGALHGEVALPARWRANLLERTVEADDGHVFELLDQVEALLAL